jgi:uncharacterized protein (TIGR02996 family)
LFPPGHEPFLARIAAAPDADGPRLVFADWLEEQGDSPRALFIRVQCALAAGGSDPTRRRQLFRLERRLLRLHGKRWRAALPLVAGMTWGRFERGFIAEAVADTEAAFEAAVSAMSAVLPRVRWFRFRSWYDPARETTPGATEPFPVPGPESPLWGQLDVLDLSGAPLAQAGPDALPRALASLPQRDRLRELRLAGCGIGTAGAAALASVRLPALERLDLSNNQLGDDGLAALLGGPLLSSVRHLGLSNNSIRERGGVALAASAWSGTPETLDLSGNALGPDTLEALADSPLLAGLRQLNLRGNFNAGTAARVLARSRHARRLEALSLAGCDLSDWAAAAFAGSECPPSLHELDLRDNLLDESSLIALLTASSTPGLQRLLLGHGQWTLRCCLPGPSEELLRAYFASPRVSRVDELAISEAMLSPELLAELADSPNLSGLSDVWLDRCEISDGGLRALAAGRYRLARLCLPGNQLTDAGAAALAGPALVGVTELDLSHNREFGDAGARRLADPALLPRLRFLDLVETAVGAAGWHALRDGRAGLVTLEVDFSRPSGNEGWEADSGHVLPDGSDDEVADELEQERPDRTRKPRWGRGLR